VAITSNPGTRPRGNDPIQLRGETGARIWRFPSCEEIATFTGTPYSVRSAAFSPDGSRLATGSSLFETVRVWDVASHEAVLSLGDGKGGNFIATGFSPDGKVHVSLS
jgi:WD40 repeat protein